MKKIGTAIIGCGAIFPVHADAIMNTDTAKLLVVADIDEKKAKDAAEKYSCAYTLDYTEILNNPEVQVVHLCTPHYLHGLMAKAFMLAGKHVLTEKPMGINLPECLVLNEISQTTRCSLGVCLQNRYHDTAIKMKELTGSGNMGRILGARAFVTWMRDNAYYQNSPWRGSWEKEGGSLLMNQAIHTLDLLQWLLGEVESVKGSTTSHHLSDIIETEDTAEAVMVFHSGARALFYGSNAYVTDAPVHIEVVCEEGSLILNGDLTVKWKNGLTEIFKDAPPSGYKSYWGTGHKALVRDFYNCIRNGLPFPVNGVEGSKAIRIIQEIYHQGLKFHLT